MLRVDIWSDVVCPWCHVGKASFDEAVRRLGWGPADIEIRYRAYELDPSVPPGGYPLGEYLRRKFGAHASIESIEGRVTEAGEARGLRFEWGKARRVNTHDAHRLLAWAWALGGAAAQAPLKGRLLEAYFAEGRDVADHGELADLAAAVGLDREEATAVLAGDGFHDEVRADRAEARERDVHAVPTFAIAGGMAIPGAQDPETYELILTRTRARLATPEGAPAGDACAVDGDAPC
ncbi:MAG: DsbA family oxidoreductase [Acidimicrobiia bacterium]|nr:DsbA family oxidoreductase [Acidimicrobiia bacterium]